MRGLIIVGGKAGAKLAEVFGRTLGYAKIRYFNTYREDVSLDDLVERQEFERLVSAGDFAYFIASGENQMRKSHHLELSYCTGVQPIMLIHPTATVETGAQLGTGVLIGPKAVINVGAKIGQGAIVNALACIEHDCVVGEFAQVSPGSILAGYCEIGAESFIGAGAVMLPGTRVGARSSVGTGAVVTRDIGPDKVVKGVPAK